MFPSISLLLHNHIMEAASRDECRKKIVFCKERKVRRFGVTVSPFDPSARNWVYWVCASLASCRHIYWVPMCPWKGFEPVMRTESTVALPLCILLYLNIQWYRKWSGGEIDFDDRISTKVMEKTIKHPKGWLKPSVWVCEWWDFVETPDWRPDARHVFLPKDPVCISAEGPDFMWAQHYAGSTCTPCPGAEGPTGG